MGFLDWLNPWADDNTNNDETTETNEEEVELEPDEGDEETFRCEYCDFSTDTQNGLNIHTGRVHGQTENEEEEEDAEEVEEAEGEETEEEPEE